VTTCCLPEIDGISNALLSIQKERYFHSSDTMPTLKKGKSIDIASDASWFSSAANKLLQT
jgi:hypothetical protein